MSPPARKRSDVLHCPRDAITTGHNHVHIHAPTRQYRRGLSFGCKVIVEAGVAGYNVGILKRELSGQKKELE